MKICLIGTVIGSTLNFRRELIQYLRHQGWDVYVFATDYTVETKRAINSLGAVPVDYYLDRGGLNPIADICSVIKLKKTIAEIGPDIVFSFFSKPVIFGTLAAKLAKTPRIIGMLEGLGYTFTINSGKGGDFKKGIVKFVQVQLYKLSFKFLDRLIFLNRDDPIDLLKKHSIKIKDVQVLGGIGVDLERYAYTLPCIDPIRFIFIGRLLAEKGIHEFIGAAKTIKNQYPEIEFIVLGGLDEENPGGLRKPELDKLLEDRIITYPGHVSDVHKWLDNSSVFVLPSYYREGVPRSSQEAMAIGRAVITTDMPGCRDTVEEGKNGFLIPIRNVDELVKKIRFFIENPSLIRSMGEESRRKAEINFCATIQVEKLSKMIVD